MQDSTMLNYLKSVLINMPSDWLNLTTHRLDIYNEKLAKTQFLDQFENLYTNNISELSALNALPTATKLFEGVIAMVSRRRTC